LTGQTEGNIPLRKPRHRWKESVKMNLRETECSDTHWINLAQDRDQYFALVNETMNLPLSYNIGIFLSNLATSGFSRRIRIHGVS
jgi:hypothetical protein